MCDSLSAILIDVKNQYPQLNGRIEKAGNLVQLGHVHNHGHNCWYVTSQADSEQSYRVEFDLVWKCECKDYQGGPDSYHPAPVCELGGSVQPVCKHVLAVMLTDWLPAQVAPAHPYGQNGHLRNCNSNDIWAMVPAQATCPRCHQQIGTNYRNCPRCFQDVHGRDE